jgi:hypothetical protein
VDNTSNNQNYIESSIALLSVYFFGDDFNVANANYYKTFAILTGWSDNEIDANFRANSTGMGSLAWRLQN